MIVLPNACRYQQSHTHSQYTLRLKQQCVLQFICASSVPAQGYSSSPATGLRLWFKLQISHYRWLTAINLRPGVHPMSINCCRTCKLTQYHRVWKTCTLATSAAIKCDTAVYIFTFLYGFFFMFFLLLFLRFCRSLLRQSTPQNWRFSNCGRNRYYGN